MKDRLCRSIFSILFGVAVFFFWILVHPEALGFQEQNQLFLFTGSYLVERLSVSGGLADYVAEFVTQFNYVPFVGALLLAGLFVLLQRLVWLLSKRDAGWYVLSFIPSCLLMVHMGDIYTMPAFLVALDLTLALSLLYRKYPSKWLALVSIPAGYWLLGPAIYLFVAFVILYDHKWSSLLYILLVAATVTLCYELFLGQYPLKSIIWGIGYYRVAATVPALQIVVALACFAVPALTCLLKPASHKWVLEAVTFVSLLLLGWGGTHWSFNKDEYEIIAYDQLVRHEQWQKLLDRAGRYQPHSEVGCVGINLSLMMTGQMDKMSSYWQCGIQGLVMPRVRDMISDVSSYEVFWRMGFINSALRYAFDSQESEMNNRKSGRHMCKIVECHIVNGTYGLAEKYISMLEHSIFYRKWAVSHRRYLNNDTAVEQDPVYGYLRASRFQDDFLFYYPEIDKMFAILYSQNQNNIMAGYYYMASQMMLKAGGEK